MSSVVAARIELGRAEAGVTAPVAAPSDAAAGAFAKPPGLAEWRLVLAVTVPFWIYLAFMRVVIFALISEGNPGVVVAPAHLRLLQHAVLLPLLLAFYRVAVALGWPEKARARGVAIHAGMAVLFALVARPILLLLVAAEHRDWPLMASLFRSAFDITASADVWAASFSDFLLTYVLGLAILLGVKSYRELKYHQLRAATLQAAWIQSRLQALRMQLNPHFLFNTLNAAVALISSRPRAAEQMLVRLAELLRRTLRDGEQELISARREADFVRSYLEVQRLRFADRLSFHVELEPGAARASVPSLLLQPLAENAVTHSLAADAERVCVDVRIRRVPAGLELTVRNSNSRVRSGARMGVGLANTRERLRTLFNDDHELALEHAADGSVLARVRIPYIESTGTEEPAEQEAA